MKKRHVITIDGLAGTGKTSVSKLLARKLGYTLLSSGLLYRGVGLLALRNGVSVDDAPALALLLQTHSLKLLLNDQNQGVLYVDGHEAGTEVFSAEVSTAASLAARHGSVRQGLHDSFRDAFPGHPLLAEGRDMGTVVFPDADLKFFIETDQSIRAERRLQQVLAGNPERAAERELLEKQLQLEIVERDKRDSERDLAPTRPAADAIIVNNSAQTLTEVVDAMYASVARRGLL